MSLLTGTRVEGASGARARCYAIELANFLGAFVLFKHKSTLISVDVRHLSRFFVPHTMTECVQKVSLRRAASLLHERARNVASLQRPSFDLDADFSPNQSVQLIEYRMSARARELPFVQSCEWNDVKL